MFGYSAKVIAQTQSQLEEKKPPNLAKIQSKGVTKDSVTEAFVNKACVTKACIVTESEGDTKELRDVKKLKKKKLPDLSKLDHNAKAKIGADRIELKKKKLPVFGIDYKVIVETKSKLKEKKPLDLSKLDMQARSPRLSPRVSLRPLPLRPESLRTASIPSLRATRRS